MCSIEIWKSDSWTLFYWQFYFENSLKKSCKYQNVIQKIPRSNVQLKISELIELVKSNKDINEVLLWKNYIRKGEGKKLLKNLTKENRSSGKKAGKFECRITLIIAVHEKYIRRILIKIDMQIEREGWHSAMRYDIQVKWKK